MAELPSPVRDFAGFYRATLAPLRRYLFRLTGDRAEAQDIAHDAYARVYPAMQDRTVEQPQAFLYTTARHLALDQLKHRARSPFDPASSAGNDDAAVSGAPGVESVVMAREEWSLLQRAVAELPPGCRQVLQLRMVDRLSHEEIACRLGLARSSVEKHLMRAVRLLHENLRTARQEKSSVILPLDRRTGSAGR